MSDDFIPKPGTLKIGGLSRAAQKLQSAKEKAANQKTGGKNFSTAASGNVKAKDSFAGKKTSFQRKAV
jgi:hypothetical protein